MSSQVILYDLPSKQGTAWSLNPWKTRMVLNFKGIDYKTEWIEYPDIAPKWKEFGIPPNPDDGTSYFTEYTIPAIQYSDGTREQHSWPIAHHLEERYPTPSLHLDDPIVNKIVEQVSKMITPLRVHFIPKVIHVLSAPSVAYFNETREKLFGAPLAEVEKNAPESGWSDAEPAAKETGDLLRKNGGPFFLGSTVSYADFIFVSMLHFMKRVDEDKFQRFMAMDPAFATVLEASKQWLERED